MLHGTIMDTMKGRMLFIPNTTSYAFWRDVSNSHNAYLDMMVIREVTSEVHVRYPSGEVLAGSLVDVRADGAELRRLAQLGWSSTARGGLCAGRQPGRDVRTPCVALRGTCTYRCVRGCSPLRKHLESKIQRRARRPRFHTHTHVPWVCTPVRNKLIVFAPENKAQRFLTLEQETGSNGFGRRYCTDCQGTTRRQTGASGR